jgi:plastocyanin domain-containing protein
MRYVLAFGLVMDLTVLLLAFPQAEPKGRRYVATIDQDGVQRVQMTAASYYFDPAEVVVKVNVPVEIIIKKTGNKPHNIFLKAPAAGIDFKTSLSAEAKVIRFTPTKTGRYSFWCTKHPPFSKSHRERGMEGVLEVVE